MREQLLMELTTLDDRLVVELRTRLSLPDVMGQAMNMSVTEMFDRWLICPQVTATPMVQGTWGALGAKRRLTLDDGGTMLETLVAVESEAGFRCVLAEFEKSFQICARTIDDAWLFEPTVDGTIIRWTWTFHAANRWQQAVGTPVRWLWGLYLRRILARQVKRWEHAANNDVARAAKVTTALSQ